MNKKHALITIILSFVAIFTWGMVSLYSDPVQQIACKSAVPTLTRLASKQEIGQLENKNDSTSAVHVSDSHTSYIEIFPDLLITSSRRECEITQVPTHEIGLNTPVTLDMSNGASDEVSPEINTDERAESNGDVQDNNLTQITVSQVDNGHNPLGFLAGWESPSDESVDQVSSDASGYQFPAFSPDGTFFYPSPGDYSMMQGVPSMGDQLFSGYEEPATGQESKEPESISDQDQPSAETPIHVQQRIQEQRPRSGSSNSSKLALYESLRRQQEQDPTGTSDATPDLSKAAQRLVLNSMNKQHNGSAVVSEKNSDDGLPFGDPIDAGDGDRDGDEIFDDANDPSLADAIDLDGNDHKSKPKEPSMFGKFKNFMKGAAGAGWRTVCNFMQANKGDANGNAGQHGADNGASNATGQH